MPAAAELLAGGRVLYAADVAEVLLLQDADVGAGALADVAEAPFRDLAGQERVGDRRSRRPDEIEAARPDDGGHLVGTGVAADADDGLAGGLAHAGGPRQLVALGVVARRAGILGPGADGHVEQVDHGIGHPHELEHLLDPDALDLPTAVDADPGGDGTVVPDGLAHHPDGLQCEPGPAGERPAVAVRAPVGPRGEELGEQVAVRAVDVDDVEPGIPRPAGTGHEVGLDAPDVVEAHLAGRGSPADARRRRARCDSRVAARDVRARVAAVVELEPRQGTVGVDGVGGEPQRGHIAVVSDVGGHVGRLVTVGRHGCVLHAHPAPPSLGLDPTEGGLGARLAGAEAGGVRHLVEAVGEGLRADRHRLEQDRMTGVEHAPTLA